MKIKKIYFCIKSQVGTLATQVGTERKKKEKKKAEYVHVGTMDGAWVSIIGS